MPHPNTTDRPTPVIVATGEILRTLTPPTLASLLVMYDTTTEDQAEIAAAIGRTQSTVSSYIRSLASLPVPLIAKRGSRYTVTDAGESIIGLISGMMDRLGCDLHAVEWQEEADKDAVAGMLTPLHDSRSTLPFLLLDSLYERSDLDGLIGTPQPVWIDDVVSDIDTRRQERGESVTTKQVRQAVQRFNEAEVLSFDGSQIELTEKGQEHVRLFHEITQLLREQDKINVSDGAEGNALTAGNDTKNRSESGESHRLPTGEDEHSHRQSVTGDITNQFQPQGFSGGQPQPTGKRNIQESPTVVLGYCVTREDTNDTPHDQQEVQPILPIREMTAEELLARLSRIVDEHDTSRQLTPYWLLDVDSGVYPLGPVEETENQSHN
ncbi:helix-turn-helix domain-containing protein [Halocatena salina]|uniref:Uncharacterized protein n=1 Tax=Halocatena salina TaxID=2934340 RepID=A0A8U0A280_9EURY|nr:hypothetical protein [Halocatena salina]UPM43172.1 hypothetical protein MW046_01685 [Halocatena salina]